MATTTAQIRVHCVACAWRGRRVRRDPHDLTRGAVRGVLPSCPACGSALVSAAAVKGDRKAEKARAELQALDAGARL